MIQRACKQLKSIKTQIIPVNKVNNNLSLNSLFQSKSIFQSPSSYVNTLKYSFAEDKRTDNFKKKLSK